MIIQQPEVEAAIAKANEVNDHYRLTHIGADDPQKYMDYILSSCGALGVGTIRIVEVDIPFKQSAVYSMCVMVGTHTDIVLAQGLNHCWRRYTICKELFHLLIDAEKYRNLNMADHTEAIALAFGVNESEPDLAVATEFLCEVAAMEFLLPYAKREYLLAQPGQPNFPAIAQQYRIPQLLVDRYLSKHYMDTLRDLSLPHSGGV